MFEMDSNWFYKIFLKVLRDIYKAEASLSRVSSSTVATWLVGNSRAVNTQNLDVLIDTNNTKLTQSSHNN